MPRPTRSLSSLLSLACLIAVAVLLGMPSSNPIQAAPQTAKRLVSPSTWILGPMQGRDATEKTFNDILNHLDQNNIPITVFHFDFDGWETCPNNGQFSWSDSLLQRMRTHNPPIRGLFWILPLIKKGCAEFNTGTAAGYFVRNRDGSSVVTSSWQGTGSWIDFKNPQAVAFWHSLLDRIFARAAGVIGGFYTDDVRPDLGNDSSYSDAFTHDLLDYTRSKLPDGEVVLKRYGANTPDDAFLAHYGHATYVNDLDGSFAGLREGIRRVFATSTLTPAPFNEFTGYSNTTPDAETYIRRLHWGTFQPVMENDNLSPSGFPWDAHYPSQVLQAYRYYTNLHWELVPYFHTYDEIAYLNNWPIFQQPNPARYSTVLGREFFIQYVTDYTQSMNVSLPAGQWINYWNEQEMHAGPATIPVAAPPGREPIWIANGAIIPMQVRDNSTGHGTTASSGALTVNVFPHGHSLFSYFDWNQKWLLLDMNQSGNSVTLCTSAQPSQPVIYRVGRWNAAPNRVAQLNGAVGINVSWGTPIPALGNETAVDASAGGWYYDAARQHLIVKLTRVGSYCPRNASSLLSGSLSTSK